jgi:hypothetical protein
MKLFSRTCASRGQVLNKSMKLQAEYEFERARRRKASEYEYVQREYAYDSAPPSQYVPTKSLESFRESIALSEDPSLMEGPDSDISGSESDDDYVLDSHDDTRRGGISSRETRKQTHERKKGSQSLRRSESRSRASPPSIQRTPSSKQKAKKFADLRGLGDAHLVIDRVPTAQGYQSDDSAENLIEEKSKASRYSMERRASQAEDRYVDFEDDASSEEERWQPKKDALEQKRESILQNGLGTLHNGDENRLHRRDLLPKSADRDPIVADRIEDEESFRGRGQGGIRKTRSSKATYQAEIQREIELSKKVLDREEGRFPDGRPESRGYLRRGRPSHKHTLRGVERIPPPPASIEVLRNEPNERDRMGRHPRSEGSKLVVGGSSYSKGKKAFGDLIGKMRGGAPTHPIKQGKDIEMAIHFATRGRERRDIRRSDREGYSRDQERHQMRDDYDEEENEYENVDDIVLEAPRSTSLHGSLSLLHGEPPSMTEVSYDRIDWNNDDEQYRASRRSRSSPHAAQLRTTQPRSPSLLYEDKPRRPQYRTPTPPLGTSPRMPPSQSTLPFESFRSSTPQLRTNGGRQVRPGNYHRAIPSPGIPSTGMPGQGPPRMDYAARASPSSGMLSLAMTGHTNNGLPRMDYAARMVDLRSGKTASMFPTLSGKKTMGNAYTAPRSTRATSDIVTAGCYVFPF